MTTKSFQICLIIVFAITSQTLSQTGWVQTFGGDKDDYASSVQQTKDGGYILVGGNYSDTTYVTPNIWLIKTDENGRIQWDKLFGGSKDDNGNSVQQTRDGGYILVGTTQSFGAGFRDICLIKTDSSGTEEWNQTFGGSYHDRASEVHQINDGGYIIVGYTRSSGAGWDDFWLIKTDSLGTEVWNKTYGGSDPDKGYSVQQTADGGYILTGETWSYGDGSNDIWVIKTDSEGIPEWSKTFGGGDDDAGYEVKQTTDGGYIITGYTRSYSSDQDLWLIKLDTIGNEDWNYAFGGGDMDVGFSVCQTTDGGYIIAGRTNSYGTGEDVYLIKTDGNGNEQWYRNIGGGDGDGASSVQQTLDGGYIIAGRTDSYGPGARDIFLIKTDSLGMVQISFSVTAGEYYDWADSLVSIASPSAQFVYSESQILDLNGKSDFWLYVFQEPFTKKCYQYNMEWKNIIRSHRVMTSNIDTNKVLKPILSGWMDSNEALNIAEYMGGSQFRTTHSNVEVSSNLMSLDSNYTIWEFNYNASGSNEQFYVNALIPLDNLYTWSAQEHAGFEIPFCFVDATSSLISWLLSVSQVDDAGRIHRTLDGGHSWHLSETNDSLHFSSIAGLSSSTALATARHTSSNHYYILKTNSGLGSWNKVHESDESPLNNITMFDNNHGIVIGNPYNGVWTILETTNGGTTWTKKSGAPAQIGTESGSPTSVCWTDSLNGWFGTSEARAYHTTDCGSNWMPISIPNLSKVTAIGSNDTGIILASSGADQNLARSTANGNNWETISFPDPNTVNYITYHNNNFWVLKDQTIYRSSDNGDSWVLETSADEALFQVSFTYDGNKVCGWAIGDRGTIMGMTPQTTQVWFPDPVSRLTEFRLEQNYPNPFNPETRIRYYVPRKSQINITIYDLLGRAVKTLINTEHDPGSYTVHWDGTNDTNIQVTSGIYIYMLQTGQYRASRKLILLK